MRALLLVDDRPTAGAGHVQRAAALAAALERLGWTCAYEDDPSCPADLVVIDDYRHDAEADRRVRGGCPVVVLDDLADRARDCDVLVSPSAGSTPARYTGLVPPGCIVLAGADHAPLRPEFRASRAEVLRRRERTEQVERVLVACGAYDSAGLSNVAAEAVLPGDRYAVIDVVIGGAAPGLAGLLDLAERDERLRVHVDVAVDGVVALLAGADVAVGTVGVSALERCVLGLPSVVVTAAENQEAQAAALVGHGAASDVGGPVTGAALRTALDLLADDLAAWRAASAAAASMCDGLGAVRVAEVATELLHTSR